MPDSQTRVTAQLGQAVGEAERALAALHAGVLREAGADFETWVALNTVATRRPSLNSAPIRLSPDTLRKELAKGLGVEEEAVSARLERLRGAGLIEHSDGEVELTKTGAELYGRIRTASTQVLMRLVEGLDAAEIEATVRNLRVLTSRAQQLAVA